MLSEDIKALLLQIQRRNCEEQTTEVKSAHMGCPQKLYDTFSSFSNQDEGGVLVFGLDETQQFKKVGVYDARLWSARYCRSMTKTAWCSSQPKFRLRTRRNGLASRQRKDG